MSTDLKVLVIDADYTSRICLIRLLEVCGIHKNTIFNVNDSACAIMVCNLNEFHLIILNVDLPDVIPMVKFLHHLRPGTKIIGIFPKDTKKDLNPKLTKCLDGFINPSQEGIVELLELHFPKAKHGSLKDFSM